MTSKQAGQAIEVLRQNAPRQSHEVRHACFAAIRALEGAAETLKFLEVSEEADLLEGRTS